MLAWILYSKLAIFQFISVQRWNVCNANGILLPQIPLFNYYTNLKYNVNFNKFPFDSNFAHANTTAFRSLNRLHLHFVSPLPWCDLIWNHLHYHRHHHQQFDDWICISNRHYTYLLTYTLFAECPICHGNCAQFQFVMLSSKIMMRWTYVRCYSGFDTLNAFNITWYLF